MFSEGINRIYIQYRVDEMENRIFENEERKKKTKHLFVTYADGNSINEKR